MSDRDPVTYRFAPGALLVAELTHTQGELQAMRDPARPLTLDLSEVTRIDGAGVQFLAALSRSHPDLAWSGILPQLRQQLAWGGLELPPA